MRQVPVLGPMFSGMRQHLLRACSVTEPDLMGLT